MNDEGSHDSDDERKVAIGVGLLSLLSLSVAIGVTWGWRPTRVVNIVAALALAISAISGQYALRALLRRTATVSRRSVLGVLALLVLGLGAGVAAQFADDDRVPGRWSALMIVGTASSLSLLMALVRDNKKSRLRGILGWTTSTLALATLVTGATVLVVGGSVVGADLVIASVFLLSPLAIGFMSEHVLESRRILGSERVRELLPHPGAIAGGVLLIAIGVGILSPQTSPLVLGVATVVMLGLVTSLTAKLPADTVVAAILFAGVLPLAPLPTTAPPPRPSADDATLVFLGDSYASGEGARTYFEGTNVQGHDTCRRSPDAYAVQVADQLDRGLVFLACSGAKSTGGSPQDLDEQIAMLGQYDDLENVEMVFFDIGGNDALFSTLGTICLAPQDCSSLREPILRELQQVGPKLDRAYAALDAAVAAAFGPDTPIAVLPYPIPVAPHGCWWSGFSNDEHAFLHDFTSRLNRLIRSRAAEHDFLIIDRAEAAYDGERICDDPRPGEAAINFFALTSVEGFVFDTANPANWLHNSLHPNRRGHDLTTSVILEWWELWQTNSLPASTPPSGVVTVDDPTRVLDGCGVPLRQGQAEAERLEECKSSMTTWARQESGVALLRVLIPIGFTVLGCWILALSSVARWRHEHGDAV